MKKLICVLTLLLMASTAIAADVDIDCQVSGSIVTVRARGNGPANRPRGIALDVTVNNGASISDVNALSVDYWVFPGSIDINDINFPSGTPVGDSSAGSITVEMGTLHYPADVNSVNAPAHSTWIELLEFTVTGSGTVDVNIVGNALRGNVVNYNANSANVAYTGCTVSFDCYTGPDFAEWVAVGKPDCWCNPRQCYGDAKNDLEGGPFSGYWYVGISDLGVLTSNWKELEDCEDVWGAGASECEQWPFGPPTPTGTGIIGTEGVCADFAHDLEGGPFSGYWYVGISDLGKLTGNWKELEDCEAVWGAGASECEQWPFGPPTPTGTGILTDCLN